MPRLWVVTDQNRDATGVFYKAYLRRMLVEIAPSGTSYGVTVRHQPLGTWGFPERFVAEAAAQLHGMRPVEDRVLLIWDTEDDSRRAARHVGRELIRRLATKLGIPEAHVHMAVVEPMTEAVYLLDDACTEALKAWLAARAPTRGRRSGPSRGSVPHLRALADRRRRAAWDSAVAMPSKDDLDGVLGRGFDKGGLAASMARVVEAPSWHSPDARAVPRLERVRGFLRSWCHPPP